MSIIPRADNGFYEFQALELGGVSQKVAIGASSTQSAALGAGKPNGGTVMVELCADQACFIKSGTNPTALNDGTSHYLPAGVPMTYGANVGDKIAAIMPSGGATGNLYIYEAP